MPEASGNHRASPPEGIRVNIDDMTYSLKSLMWRAVGIERNAEGQYLVRFKEAEETLPVSRRHAAEALRQFRSGLKTWNRTATT
jgi:hypothetical protein